MAPVLVTLSPMLAYAALCALLGWRNRRTHDPPHIGVVGRVLEPPDDLPPRSRHGSSRPPRPPPSGFWSPPCVTWRSAATCGSSVGGGR